MECNIMYYYVWNTVEKVKKVLLSSKIDRSKSTDYIWDVVTHKLQGYEMKVVIEFSSKLFIILPQWLV